MMKIGIVIETFRAGGGGNERSTLQIASRLQQRGHQVTILTNRTSYEVSDLPGIKIIAADGSATSHCWGLRKFVKWAKRQIAAGEFDVSMSVTTAVPADIVQPRSGTVKQTLEQNIKMRPTAGRQLWKRLIVITSPKQTMLLAAERATIRSPQVKLFAANSQYVVDQLKQLYSVPDEKIIMIPNASELQVDFARLPAIRNEQRKALGIADDVAVYLFIAMNPRLKGGLPLVEAWAKLIEKQPKALLLCVGNLTERMNERIRDLGIEKQVKIVGKTENMGAMYALADVVILPTFYDPASKVVLEALLYGKPAISTLHNGASQWIIDPSGQEGWQSALGQGPHEKLTKGKAGFVISTPHAVDEMAEAMAVLADPAIRATLSPEASVLDAALNMDVHVDTLETVMQQIADDKNAT